jgi:hypothetical protein
VPAPVPTPGFLKVTLGYNIAEDVDVHSRFYLKYGGGPPSVSDCTSLGLAIGSDWNTYLAELSQSPLETTRVTDLTSQSASDSIASTVHAGTRTGSFIPAGCCLLTNFHIARRYRGGKPKMFWPFGVQSDLQDGQTWDTAFQTLCTNQINDFFTAVFGASSGTTTITGLYSIGYYHKFQYTQPDPVTGRIKLKPTALATPYTDPVITVTVNPKVSYQRRRAVR